MSADDETNPEVQVRLHHERECRRIAAMVKAELPEDRAFILMTVTRGPAHADFSSTDYIATVRPEDAVRLLHEHIDRLSVRTGMAGEPTATTCCVLREMVHQLMEGGGGERPPKPEPLWRDFSAARKGAGTPQQRAAAFRAMAVAVLMELEFLQRGQLGTTGRMV